MQDPTKFPPVNELLVSWKCKKILWPAKFGLKQIPHHHRRIAFKEEEGSSFHGNRHSGERLRGKRSLSQQFTSLILSAADSKKAVAFPICKKRKSWIQTNRSHTIKAASASLHIQRALHISSLEDFPEISSIGHNEDTALQSSDKPLKLPGTKRSENESTAVDEECCHESCQRRLLRSKAVQNLACLVTED